MPSQHGGASGVVDGLALAAVATRRIIEDSVLCRLFRARHRHHSFGTGLANAGVPVHVIKTLMGHKSIETTLRYMHTDRAAKRDAIDALRGSHVAASHAGSKQPAEN